MKYKLAALTSHPIQYQAPFFRKLAAHPDIDLTVYFCWSFGVKKEQLDPGFGVKFKWDIPLLEGYKYKFLSNLSLRPSSSFLGQINPAILRELCFCHYDALWVHGYSSLTNWLAFLGAWMTKTPILLRGDSHLLDKMIFCRRIIKRVLLGPLFKKIAAFLAIGRLNKEYYLSCGVPGEKIFLAPYAVDDEFFNQQNKIWNNRYQETREELGIAQDSVVILYTGRLFARKGPLDVLKAFEKLEDSNLANLIFVGDGKDKPLLEKYARKQRVNNVMFTGFKNQTELPKYYSIADILVLPSYTERWGMVINEAMYFDTAIIASDCVGAAYDLVYHGINGYIFPAGHIDTLARLFEKLIENRDLLSQMKTASGKIIQDWNLDLCVSGVMATLDYVKRTR